MKKFTALLLALSLVFCFSSCDSRLPSTLDGLIRSEEKTGVKTEQKDLPEADKQPEPPAAPENGQKEKEPAAPNAEDGGTDGIFDDIGETREAGAYGTLEADAAEEKDSAGTLSYAEAEEKTEAEERTDGEDIKNDDDKNADDDKDGGDDKASGEDENPGSTGGYFAPSPLAAAEENGGVTGTLLPLGLDTKISLIEQPDGVQSQTAENAVTSDSGITVYPAEGGRLIAAREENGGYVTVDEFQAFDGAEAYSLAFDSEGNLFAVSGADAVDPENSPAGSVCMIKKEYFDGEAAAADSIYRMTFSDGEACENDMLCTEEGMAVLTNSACYMLKAGKSGIETVFETAYETGFSGGESYGSGSGLTQTEEFLLFTDNAEELSLVVLDKKTGETVLTQPLFGVKENTAVEYPVIAYGQEDSVCVIVNNVCALDSAEEDGEEYSGGMTRVDIEKTDDGYRARKVWTRDDIISLSGFVLSSSSGYLYGYTQNGGVNGLTVLDIEQGRDTAFFEVSLLERYRAQSEIYIKGSAVCCDTAAGSIAVYDRLAAIDEAPFYEFAPGSVEFAYMPDETFTELSGRSYEVLSPLMTASFEGDEEKVTLSFSVSSLSAKRSDCKLFSLTADGNMVFVPVWDMRRSDGSEVGRDETLSEDEIYTISVTAFDGAARDTDSTEGSVSVSVVLAGGYNS